MTMDDIEHIAQCLVALKSSVGKEFTQEEFDRMIDRFLWAIHASKDTPFFDGQQFHDRANGFIHRLDEKK